jgi:two-component system, NarL family, nitrate/nitrite response regulator NarL
MGPANNTINNVNGKAIRVLIADDDPLVRSAVSAMVTSDGTCAVVAEAADGQEVLNQVRQHKPDVLLLDLSMPRKAGLEALRDLGNGIGSMKTVVLTVAADRRQTVEALQLGASGILMKEQAGEHLLDAIKTVLAGRYWIRQHAVEDGQQIIRELLAEEPAQPDKRGLLSARELQIVRFIVEGCTNKDIAATLQTSEQVVKNHLGKIFDKLGVFNRLELALYALDNRLVDR